MKSPCLLFSLTVSVVVALAADPLTEAFRRGLLAEESQRDLKAAAAAYGEVLQQADAQRELVATALFRLAETQRRLGRTNEALAGYRRLVREFSDQTNLTGLAAARLPEKAAGGPGVQLLEAQKEHAGQLLARTSREQTELAGFLRQTRALASLGEISSALAARYPSVELQRLRAERNSAEVAAARLHPDFGPQHPEVVRNKAVLAKLDEQLEREITSILSGLDVREQSLGADVEAQRRIVRLLEAKLAQERQDALLAAQGEGPERAGLSRLRSSLAMFESARDEAVAAFNRLTEVARVVAAVKPGQITAQLQIAEQLQHAPELGELVTEGKILTEGRDSLEAEAADLEGKLGANDAKVRELRDLLAKQDESLEVLRKQALAAFQTRLQSLGFTLKTMDAGIETLRGKLRQAETDALLSGRPTDPVGEQRRLLAEEIRVAEEQVAEIRLQMSQGAATQAELLQAQRDVLGLKRQAAGLTRADLMDVIVASAPVAPAPEQAARWASVGGEVKLPGALKLPDDRSMDLFEAINERGGLTTKGNPNRIQVGRGTNVFRFKLDELMTNRFELQHEDKIQVMEKLF